MLAQIDSLKSSLRESLAKAGEVQRWLRRHRRQTRLVRSTLDSLAQLRVGAE